MGMILLNGMRLTKLMIILMGLDAGRRFRKDVCEYSQGGFREGYSSELIQQQEEGETDSCISLNQVYDVVWRETHDWSCSNEKDSGKRLGDLLLKELSNLTRAGTNGIGATTRLYSREEEEGNKRKKKKEKRRRRKKSP